MGNSIKTLGRILNFLYRAILIWISSGMSNMTFWIFFFPEEMENKNQEKGVMTSAWKQFLKWQNTGLAFRKQNIYMFLKYWISDYDEAF